MNGESTVSSPVLESSASAPQSPANASPLADRLNAVLADVAASARKVGRLPDEITVVAVSKTVDRPAVDEAFALGMRHFGENRVQDTSRHVSETMSTPASLPIIRHDEK